MRGKSLTESERFWPSKEPMESVSCFGTQKPWHEKAKAVTANHGF